MKIYFKNIKVSPLSHDYIEIILANLQQNKIALEELIT